MTTKVERQLVLDYLAVKYAGRSLRDVEISGGGEITCKIDHERGGYQKGRQSLGWFAEAMHEALDWKDRATGNSWDPLVSVYDNGGKTCDRYTVVYKTLEYSHTLRRWWYSGIGMSDNPGHPQGYGQHFERKDLQGNPPTWREPDWAGRKIAFRDLPVACMSAVLADLEVLEEGNPHVGVLRGKPTSKNKVNYSK